MYKAKPFVLALVLVVARACGPVPSTSIDGSVLTSNSGDLASEIGLVNSFVL